MSSGIHSLRGDFFEFSQPDLFDPITITTWPMTSSVLVRSIDFLSYDVIIITITTWPMTSSILARSIDFLILWRHHYHPDNLKVDWVRMNIYLSRFDLSNPCDNLKKCACVVLKNDFPVPLSCESIKPVSPVAMGHASRGWLPSTCVLIPWLLRKMRVGIME